MTGAGAQDDAFVYGVHPVLETLKARPRSVREILTAREIDRGGALGEIGRRARSEGIRVRRVSRHELGELLGERVHQGIAARLEGAAQAPRVSDPLDLVDAAKGEGRDPLLLVLDGIQDPHNLGALLRSAWALGADGVIAPIDRAADLTPTAVKASAGAAAHCPFVRVVNLARTLDGLKAAGVWVVGADPGEGAEELDRVDLTGPMALVVGAEGPGIRRLVLEACDRRVKIPMWRDFGSLNASVAGGVLLWEAARQRRSARGTARK